MLEYSRVTKKSSGSITHSDKTSTHIHRGLKKKIWKIVSDRITTKLLGQRIVDFISKCMKLNIFDTKCDK